MNLKTILFVTAFAISTNILQKPLLAADGIDVASPSSTSTSTSDGAVTVQQNVPELCVDDDIREQVAEPSPKDMILSIIGENLTKDRYWYCESTQRTCPEIQETYVSLVGQLSKLSGQQQDLVFEQLGRIKNLRCLTLTFNNLTNVSPALIELCLKNPGCTISFNYNPFFASPVRGEAPRDLDVLGIKAAHAKGLTGRNVNILVIESETFEPNVLFVPEVFMTDIRKTNKKSLQGKTHAHAKGVLSILAGHENLTGRSPIAPGAKICLEDVCEVFSKSLMMTSNHKWVQKIVGFLGIKKMIYPDYHIANCSFLDAGNWLYGFIRGFQGIIVFGLGNDHTNFHDEHLESLMNDPEIYHKVIFAGALDICGYRQTSYTCVPGREPFIARTLFATGGGRNKENEDNLPVINGNDIKYVTGTSFAAPMITGALALLFEYAHQQALDLNVHEILRPQQVATILLETANKAILVNDQLRYDPAKHGQGKIDLNAAMRAIDLHYEHSLSAIHEFKADCQ